MKEFIYRILSFFTAGEDLRKMINEFSASIPITAKGDSLANIYNLVIDCSYKIYFQKNIISKKAFCLKSELIDLHIIPN